MVSLKEAQEKVMKYQTLNERLRMLNNRRQLLISKVLEIEGTLDSIKELENEEKSEIVLPLGSGVYMNSSVKNEDKMLVMISRDVAVEMGINKTKDTLEKNKRTLENGIKVVENDMIKIQEEMAKLEPDVRDFVERQQQIKQSQ